MKLKAAALLPSKIAVDAFLKNSSAHGF